MAQPRFPDTSPAPRANHTTLPFFPSVWPLLLLDLPRAPRFITDCRWLPAQAWYLNLLSTMIIGGILPFGAVFIELYFIMSSVWLQRFYYVFGFLALVLFILLVGRRVGRRAPDDRHPH